MSAMQSNMEDEGISMYDMDSAHGDCHLQISIGSESMDSPSDQVKDTEVSPSPSNSGSRSSPPPLPPCKICGEKSSGFHYGANTCEACKGFFRRTLKKQVVNFKCICKGNQKSKTTAQKSICPACRYQRCLTVGMSRNAIKIGRYTLTRKTQNIREVKRLEGSEEKRKQSGNTDEGFHSPGSISNSPSTSGYASSDLDLLPLTQQKRHTDHRSPEARRRWENAEDLEKLTKLLAEATRNLVEPELFEINQPDKKEIRQNYLRQYQQQSEMFGDMGFLSMEEFWDFYDCTGIDLDNRFQLLKEIVVFAEKKIKDLIAFAKVIPGFNNLPIQDQANLIKATRPEQHVFTIHRAIDEDLGVITPPWGSKRVYHKNEFAKIGGKSQLEHKLWISRKIRKLDLPLEVEALVRAVMLTASDRGTFDQAETIQAMQYQMLDCLEYVISKMLPQQPNALAHIISALTDIRSVCNSTCEVVTEKVMNHPLLKEHTLMKELIS